MKNFKESLFDIFLAGLAFLLFSVLVSSATLWFSVARGFRYVGFAFVIGSILTSIMFHMAEARRKSSGIPVAQGVTPRRAARRVAPDSKPALPRGMQGAQLVLHRPAAGMGNRLQRHL